MLIVALKPNKTTVTLFTKGEPIFKLTWIERFDATLGVNNRRKLLSRSPQFVTGKSSNPPSYLLHLNSLLLHYFSPLNSSANTKISSKLPNCTSLLGRQCSFVHSSRIGREVMISRLKTPWDWLRMISCFSPNLGATSRKLNVQDWFSSGVRKWPTVNILVKHTCKN